MYRRSLKQMIRNLTQHYVDQGTSKIVASRLATSTLTKSIFDKDYTVDDAYYSHMTMCMAEMIRENDMSAEEFDMSEEEFEVFVQIVDKLELQEAERKAQILR